MNHVQELTEIIREYGPIKAVRVSSAQARGRAKQYPYWGTALYEIRLRKRDGVPTIVPVQRASSDRRSFELAVRDAVALAEEHNLAFIGTLRPGPITDEEIARRLLLELVEEYTVSDYIHNRPYSRSETVKKEEIR